MTHSPSFPHSITADHADSRLRERIQLALASADEPLLQSLLTNCKPAIASADRIGYISSAICLAAPNNQTVDGIIEFEHIQCRLASSQNSQSPSAADYGWNANDYRRYTRYQSDTYILANRLPVPEAEALLLSVGFDIQQAAQILQMPPSATFKSWWFACDRDGQFTLPFLRILRTTYFANGTVTLKYQDAFEQFEPPCFRSTISKVLVEIRPTITRFARALARINRHRAHNAVDAVILISDRLSPTVANAFVRQGISLYPDIQLNQGVAVDCTTCRNVHCRLQGFAESPVTGCKAFLPSDLRL